MLQTIATCITATGVVIALHSLRSAQRQRLRQFELMYVQRYWDIMDRFSLVATRGDTPDTDSPSEEDQKAAWSYIRLCEDQLDLRRGGWISDRTWAEWSNGIELELERWPVRQVWRSASESLLQRDFRSLHAFETSRVDPCRISRIAKYISGIGHEGPNVKK